jgi:hypothetical protein
LCLGTSQDLTPVFYAVTDFIDEQKITRIAEVLAETGPDALSLAKQTLGEDYSYGEIKMVQAHLARSR